MHKILYFATNIKAVYESYSIKQYLPGRAILFRAVEPPANAAYHAMGERYIRRLPQKRRRHGRKRPAPPRERTENKVNTIVCVIISVFFIFGVYCAAGEIGALAARCVRYIKRKIDKTKKKRYNIR